MKNTFRIDTSEAAAAMTDEAVMTSMDEAGMSCWVRPGPDGIGIVDDTDGPDWSTTVLVEPNAESLQYLIDLIAEVASRGHSDITIRPIGDVVDIREGVQA